MTLQELRIENLKLLINLAMFGEDTFADHDTAEDARDELKFELAILNGALKDLNKNWDFTDIIRPLLSDQGPANAVVPKLKKQIERMTKIKDDFLRREEEKKQAGAPVQREEERNQADALPRAREQQQKQQKDKANVLRLEHRPREEELSHTGQGGPSADPTGTCYLRKRRGPRAAQSTPNLVIPEVLPAWSPLKRYTDLDTDSYQELVKAARWVFEYMQSSPGGALSCTMRRCIDSVSTASPVPPVSKDRLLGYFGNRYF